METLSIKVKHGKMDIYMQNQQNLDNLQYCDTINPKIFDYTYNKISEKSGIVSVKISDDESGISFYRGEINGKWILMDYDFKTNLLKYEIDNEKIVKENKI